MTAGLIRRCSYQGLMTWRHVFTAVYSAIIVGVVFSSICVVFVLRNPSRSSPWSGSSSVITYEVAEKRGDDAIPGKRVVSEDSSREKVSWRKQRTGSKMPPLEFFRLSKEFVGKRVKDNVIIVAFGNYAVMEFILNWVEHLVDLDLYNFIIGATDHKLLEALYWRGYPVFDMNSNISTGDLSWGTDGFYQMGRERARLVDALLPYGYEFLISDTDVAWLKNPLPYFARYPDADVLTSTDQLAPTAVDGGLELWKKTKDAYNVGIFFWRPTINSKKLAKAWKKTLLRDAKIWDQGAFNDITRKRLGPSVAGGGGVVYAFDGNLKLGILPTATFCNGHTYFVQGMAKRFGLKPYAVHATHQFSGPEGKRHVLREGMFFRDPPEYYDVPGGFLSFNPAIPKTLLFDGPNDVVSHFRLVNYQIKQIRTALAIASLLGRTLVLPPLWCRLDRLYSSHPGIVPGSVTQQPFLCPFGQVFKVNYMLQDLEEEKYGPMINFREHSFFENPWLPKHVKDSSIYVRLCEDGVGDCKPSLNLTSGGILSFPMNSSEETLMRVFESFKDVKVLHFSSIKDAFAGFEEKSLETRFRNRVKTYLDRWCCMEGTNLGHIYYDMYWDEKPNWMPKPPLGKEDDHPPL